MRSSMLMGARLDGQMNSFFRRHGVVGCGRRGSGRSGDRGGFGGEPLEDEAAPLEGFGRIVGWGGLERLGREANFIGDFEGGEIGGAGAAAADQAREKREAVGLDRDL